MKDAKIRLQKIIIDNLKNVEHGEIRFTCNTKSDIFEEGSDILGLYGQNGSGKTTLIFALDILKHVVIGFKLFRNCENYIRLGSETAKIVYEFSYLDHDKEKYYIRYQIELKRREEKSDSPSYSLIEEIPEKMNPVFISYEELSYKKLINGKWTKYTSIISYKYDSEYVFTPEIRYNEFISKDKSLADEVKYNKTVAYKSSCSFIFTLGRIKNINDRHGFKREYQNIMDALQIYASKKLYVLSNVQMSIVNANIVLPMTFVVQEKYRMSFTNVDIELTGETNVPEEIYEMIVKRFNIVNTVINKLIPGTELYIVKRGTKIEYNNKNLVIIELISKRGETEIPLRYESDGIKKLVYALYSIVLMYNDSSVTVAIDELDSGIFEYLLGEILIALQENGKGQLIFTSHNLRALEVLDKKNVMFSTVNPTNRYIRFKNVKGTNNLRDVYYQDILLGGQDECVYETTSPFSIRRAFRTAGDILNG